MASRATYYLNGPSLSSATSVFTDDQLVFFAPNGFYSDGTITREMVDGVLLPPVTCPSCGEPCGDEIDVTGVEGEYNVTVNTGNTSSDVGAIIIKFNSYDKTQGFRAVFNGTVYNTFSSPVSGLLSANPGVPIYIGPVANDCGLVAGSPFTVPIMAYYAGLFYNTTVDATVTVVPGQLALATGNQNDCVMVIPKTSITPTGLDIQILSLCSSSRFTVSTTCPLSLPSFNSSVRAASSVLACALPQDQYYYSAPVNGDGVTLGLYDWVFSDANGENVLPDGFYLAAGAAPAPNRWFRVDSGIIVEFDVCVP